MVFCGSHKLITGETISNKLYVQFYSDFYDNDVGFNITYHKLQGKKKAILVISLS